MRKEAHRNSTTVDFRKCPLGENPAQTPYLGLRSTQPFLPLGSYHPDYWLPWPFALVFPLEEFHFAQTVLLLAILVSLAGLEANKAVSKPMLSLLPGRIQSWRGKSKPRLVLENKAGPQGKLTRESAWMERAAIQVMRDSKLH